LTIAPLQPVAPEAFEQLALLFLVAARYQDQVLL